MRARWLVVACAAAAIACGGAPVGDAQVVAYPPTELEGAHYDGFDDGGSLGRLEAAAAQPQNQGGAMQRTDCEVVFRRLAACADDPAFRERVTSSGNGWATIGHLDSYRSEFANPAGWCTRIVAGELSVPWFAGDSISGWSWLARMDDCATLGENLGGAIPMPPEADAGC